MGFFNFKIKENNTESHVDNEDVISENTMALTVQALMAQSVREAVISAMELDTVTEEFIQEGVLNEKTIIKLDKDAKYAQALKITVLSLAKEANDPDFNKFVTIKKLERRQEEKLMKKYGSRAAKTARAAAQKWDPKKGRYKGSPDPAKKK